MGSKKPSLPNARTPEHTYSDLMQGWHKNTYFFVRFKKWGSFKMLFFHNGHVLWDLTLYLFMCAFWVYTWQHGVVTWLKLYMGHSMPAQLKLPGWPSQILMKLNPFVPPYKYKMHANNLRPNSNQFCKYVGTNGEVEGVLFHFCTVLCSFWLFLMLITIYYVGIRL